METQTFATFFGGLARLFTILAKPLHLVSFLSATWFFYAFYSGQVAAFGLGGNGLAWITVWVVTLATGLLIEVLHFFVPSLFFRLALTVNRWWTSPTAWVMFVLLGSMVAGLTVASAFTSQGGAVDIARSQFEAPPTTDISGAVASYRADSVRFENMAQAEAQAVALAFDGEVKAAAAPFDAEIATLKAALVGHEKDKRNGNAWAQGWIDKREGQIATAKARRAEAVAKAEAGRAGALAAALANKGQLMAGATSTYLGTKTMAADIDRTAAANAVESNGQLVALAKAGSVNVVYLILLLSFLVTFYNVFSGHEYQGSEFRPSGRFSRAWSHVSGIFADKADHVLDRLEATQKHLKTRTQAEAFVFPSGRNALLGASTVAVAFFVVQTAIYSESDHVQASIVPFPYNWLGLILAVLSLVLFVPKRAKARTGGATGVTVPEPVTETVTESVAETVPVTPPPPVTGTHTVTDQTAETVVRRGVTGPTPEAAGVTTPEELTRLKTYARVNYDRSHTAATDEGRQSAGLNFQAARDTLTDAGYVFTYGPDKVKKTVTSKGSKPVTKSYPALHIS